jgi:hypothetical protein
MPIFLSSFLLPLSGRDYFLLEDIYLRGGFQVHLDTAKRDAIPAGNRKAGMLVHTQSDKKIWQLDEDMETWTEFKTASDGGGTDPGGGATLLRKKVEYTVADIPAQFYADFQLTMGNSVIVYSLRVSSPCIVEVHETRDRIDTNPYRFIATEEQLFDDGTAVMEDGTIVRNRRYSIWANMEEEPNGDIYFRVLNTNEESPITVTILLTYLTLETFNEE